MALAPKSINTSDSDSRSTKIFSLLRSRCTTPFLQKKNQQKNNGRIFFISNPTVTWLN
jgi:hypothetical protein